MSTGPYKFQSYQTNKQLVLVPNPNWDPTTDPQRQAAGRARSIVKFNVNAHDLDNRLMAGDIDVDAPGTGVQAAARAKILSDPTLKARRATPSPATATGSPTSTPRSRRSTTSHCRKAIEYAVDKTDLQTAWGGPIAGGEIATTLLPPGMTGYSKFDLYNATAGSDRRPHRGEGGADASAASRTASRSASPYRSDRPAETSAVTGAPGVAGPGRHQAAAARLPVGQVLQQLRRRARTTCTSTSSA